MAVWFPRSATVVPFDPPEPSCFSERTDQPGVEVLPPLDDGYNPPAPLRFAHLDDDE